MASIIGCIFRAKVVGSLFQTASSLFTTASSGAIYLSALQKTVVRPIACSREFIFCMTSFVLYYGAQEWRCGHCERKDLPYRMKGLGANQP